MRESLVIITTRGVGKGPRGHSDYRIFLRNAHVKKFRRGQGALVFVEGGRLVPRHNGPKAQWPVQACVFQTLVLALVNATPRYVSSQCCSQADTQVTSLRAHYTLLRDLHWLRSLDGIDFKLAVLVYRCLHGVTVSVLTI